MKDDVVAPIGEEYELCVEVNQGKVTLEFTLYGDGLFNLKNCVLPVVDKLCKGFLKGWVAVNATVEIAGEYVDSDCFEYNLDHKEVSR